MAVGLLRKRTNCEANRLLSGLVLILTLKLIPYVIGYAGFYMAYPWLDLAPFDLSLGIGPLLFLYVARLTQPELPRGWRWHLVPVTIQLVLYVGLFVQSMSFKNWFERRVGPAFNWTENLLEAASLALYVGWTWSRYRDYDQWLRNRFGDPDAHRLKYLRGSLILLSTTLLTFVAAKVWGLIGHPLSYFQMFPVYMLLTAVVYAFGFTAFQFADMTFPIVEEPPAAKETDWRAIAEAYSLELEASSFWKDPLLSISTAAVALNTSEGRLSKAINAGLDITFSEWINQHRLAQVVEQLREEGDSVPIAEIAYACGFNSKATFHRWFRSIYGCTPTEYRDRLRQAQGHGSTPRPVPPQFPRPSA